MAKFMADIHMAEESADIYALAAKLPELYGLKELNDFEVLYGESRVETGWPAIGIRCFTPRAAKVIIAAYC